MTHAWVLLQLSLAAGWLAARFGGARAREARWILVASLLAPLLALVPGASGVLPSLPSQAFEPVTHTARAVIGGTTPHAQRFDILSIVIIAAFAFGAARFALAVLGLARELRAAEPWHRAGRVRVLSAPRAHFAAWWGGPVLVLDRAASRLARRHEAQHHRHGDPLRAWVLMLLGIVTEPMATPWRRLLAGLEEMEVDAALVRRGVDPRAYAHALIAAAGPASQLAPGLSRTLLHRRVHMLLHPARRRSIAVILAVPLLALPALAAKSLATVTDEEAASLAPDGVTTDGVVLAELANLTSSRDGKRFTEAALARRDARIPQALQAAGLPAWLEAVPLVESGFKNMAETSNEESAAPGFRGAGVWMFIPSTARTFGLRVDASVDERLDFDRETAAAISYLTQLHEQFGDWPLALAAYNQGGKAVTKAIEAEGTRDAWELQRRGALNPYAARVIAAAIILAKDDAR